jgi:hypothetical protein
MTHTERLLRVPATFRRLTGLSTKAFAGLLPQLEAAWRQDQARRASRPGRKRKPGGGEARKLSDLGGGVVDLAWSPDGKQIAVIAGEPETKAG